MTRRTGLIVKTETETRITEMIKDKLNLRLFVAGNEISLIDLCMYVYFTAKMIYATFKRDLSYKN